MEVSGHLFLEHISTELQRVVIWIGLEQSSAATNGWWGVRDLGTQGRRQSAERKWVCTSPFFFFFFFFQSARPLFHSVSYMSEWRWSSLVLSLPRLLRRSLSDHLDAVLLELRSEQSVFVLQFFNLHNRTNKQKVSASTFFSFFFYINSSLNQEQTFWFERSSWLMRCPRSGVGQ